MQRVTAKDEAMTVLRHGDSRSAVRHNFLTPVIAMTDVVYTMPTCPLLCSIASRLVSQLLQLHVGCGFCLLLRTRHASTSADGEFEPSEVYATRVWCVALLYIA